MFYDCFVLGSLSPRSPSFSRSLLYSTTNYWGDFCVRLVPCFPVLFFSLLPCYVFASKLLFLLPIRWPGYKSEKEHVFRSSDYRKFLSAFVRSIFASILLDFTRGSKMWKSARPQFRIRSKGGVVHTQPRRGTRELLLVMKDLLFFLFRSLSLHKISAKTRERLFFRESCRTNDDYW